MASSTNRRRSIAAILAAGFVLSACWGGGDEVTSNTLDSSADTTVVDTDPIVTVDGLPAGEEPDDADLEVQLSEGASGDDTAEPTPVAEGAALDQTQIDEVVRHEGFHRFLHEHLEAAPLWFNEGCAEYFASARESFGGDLISRTDWTSEGTLDNAAAVRGMLPRSPLGRAMMRKLKVYAGPEHQHQAQQPKVLDI